MSGYIEKTPWLVSYARKKPYKYRLFCFPYAGGGARVFSKWQNYLPEDVEVIAVCLPGREAHNNTTARSDWPELLATLFENILPALDRPYFFFGHSLGARICYELAHQLFASDFYRPKQIFVSACSAPGIEPLKKPMHQMNLEELVVHLHKMGGVPKEVLNNKRIMQMLEPTLKADFKLAETWHGSRSKINSPIIAMSGKQDDISPLYTMVPWGLYTSKGFSHHQFSGGHFFLDDCFEEVLAFVTKQLHSDITRNPT